MMILRNATLADAELLRAWKNDPEMQRNSFHSAVVGKREHARWMRESLKSKTRRLYAAEATTGTFFAPGFSTINLCAVVGEGRLDFNGKTIEFDVEVAPEHRGHGYGGEIVAALVAKAREWKPGVPLIAHVKAFNAPSLRMFLGAGFKVQGKRCLRLEMR